MSQVDLLQKANVLGLAVHPLDMSAAVSQVLAAAQGGTASYACLVGAHGVVEARGNPQVAAAFQDASLVLPDGMPTVWIGRSQGFSSMGRVFGPDLMLRVVHQGHTLGIRHFLLGGKPGVAEELAAALTAKCPNAIFVGTYTPPFRELSPSEEHLLFQKLQASRPDIVWVGISTPKQELFMQRYHRRLGAGVMVGVGAAFDFHTGRLKDSPAWVKRAGLQWFHRCLQEPRRLAWRYMRTNTIFLYLLLLAVLRIKKFPTLSPAAVPSSIVEQSWAD
jgi:N-acetylglucosaminyldiphosphoundecaprenol N-acetyl-beta-D-mannosaminyltransferase